MNMINHRKSELIERTYAENHTGWLVNVFKYFGQMLLICIKTTT